MSETRGIYIAKRLEILVENRLIVLSSQAMAEYPIFDSKRLLD